jgi:hypothetical protein
MGKNVQAEIIINLKGKCLSLYIRQVPIFFSPRTDESNNSVLYHHHHHHHRRPRGKIKFLPIEGLIVDYNHKYLAATMQQVLLVNIMEGK